jgi:heavy metal sensor kinase
MRNLAWLKDFSPPLRLRLTIWYVFVLSLILALFGGYLYFRLQQSLLNQVDAGLQFAATQALADLDTKESRPTFQREEITRDLARHMRRANLAIRLIGLDGNVWAGLGEYEEVPKWLPEAAPDYTFLLEDNEPWRVYSQPVQAADGRIIGWLQTAQSLEDMQEALQRFREQIFLAVPLALLLAGGGGFFLANRALRPIDQITRTAQTINSRDLTQRINYQGPTDEVGRLAITFNRMLARLQSAFERERRFTADAAHELRTPLTTLKGRIGVTLSQSRTQTDYESTLQALENEVDRLIRLSADLLFLARLDQGHGSRPTDRLNLSQLLEAVVEQVRPLAETKGLRLIEEISPALFIQGDPDHLIRLFLNLLDNAIKYTPPPGHITVRLQKQEAGLRITIKDTGPGIPSEHLAHLFERFYRVEAARSRSPGGAGLGLAIAHEIAREYGGTLEAQSEPGRGATFTVYLPV